MTQKRFLFVDDDRLFLSTVKELFLAMSEGAWTIFTAQNHAQALEILQGQRVEVVVLDIGMPVLDGFQFLRLINRTHPGQQVVMLTGQLTPERKKMCLENGATFLLEKPVTREGYSEIFAALDALAGAHPQTGFRGTMRQVGLQEVLQMECLGRKSSILQIFTGKVKGRIFISDGSIIHAESGALHGEAALYGLLALRGGEFNLLAFTEPSSRTIAGHWEFLLMEAARLSDEGTSFVDLEKAAVSDAAAADKEPAIPMASLVSEMPSSAGPIVADLARRTEVRIAETLLCSGGGEVLYEAGCDTPNRMVLFEQIEQQATQLSALAPIGRFDRLEIHSLEGRVICQVQPDRRLFVRSVPLEPVSS